MPCTSMAPHSTFRPLLLEVLRLDVCITQKMRHSWMRKRPVWAGVATRIYSSHTRSRSILHEYAASSTEEWCVCTTDA